MDTVLEHERVDVAAAASNQTGSIFAAMEITDAGAACDCDCDCDAGDIDNY